MENLSFDEKPDNVGCVYELFNTSRGLIAVMDFPEKVVLNIGANLISKSGHKWKLIGIDMPMPIEMTNFKFTPRFGGLLFGCLLQPVGHSEIPEPNEILQIIA